MPSTEGTFNTKFIIINIMKQKNTLKGVFYTSPLGVIYSTDELSR